MVRESGVCGWTGGGALGFSTQLHHPLFFSPASLLVVAAHQRGGPLAALASPSAAASTALASPLPTIVLHSPAAASLPATPPRRVLLAVDAVDGAALEAATWALDNLLARREGDQEREEGVSEDDNENAPPSTPRRELHALHVVPRAPPSPEFAGLDGVGAAAAPGSADALASWRAGDDDPAVGASLDAAVAALDASLTAPAAAAGATLIAAAVADVSVGDAIADAAAAIGADAVVVVHRGGRSAVDVALRGSVAAHVVRAVDVPVVVLHK